MIDARDWPEDATHENGNYQNRCVSCQQAFIGHKRRVTCKACASVATIAHLESALKRECEGQGAMAEALGFDHSRSYIQQCKVMRADRDRLQSALSKAATDWRGFMEFIRACQTMQAIQVETVKAFKEGEAMAWGQLRMAEDEADRNAQMGRAVAASNLESIDPPRQARIWICRFHPTDWFHEVGCPHVIPGTER